MRGQISLFSRVVEAGMRHRTQARNWSTDKDAFRLEHARRRDWGLAQRHAEKLRREYGSVAAANASFQRRAAAARESFERRAAARAVPPAEQVERSVAPVEQAERSVPPNPAAEQADRPVPPPEPGCPITAVEP